MPPPVQQLAAQVDLSDGNALSDVSLIFALLGLMLRQGDSPGRCIFVRYQIFGTNRRAWLGRRRSMSAQALPIKRRVCLEAVSLQ